MLILIDPTYDEKCNWLQWLQLHFTTSRTWVVRKSAVIFPLFDFSHFPILTFLFTSTAIEPLSSKVRFIKRQERVENRFWARTWVTNCKMAPKSHLHFSHLSLLLLKYFLLPLAIFYFSFFFYFSLYFYFSLHFHFSFFFIYRFCV